MWIVLFVQAVLSIAAAVSIIALVSTMDAGESDGAATLTAAAVVGIVFGAALLTCAALVPRRLPWVRSPSSSSRP